MSKRGNLPGLGVCVGKKPYDTSWEAAAVRRSHHKDEGHRVKTYECPICGKWHNGHVRKGR